jgi:hypothetical protein
MQSSFLPYVVNDKLLVHDNHVVVAVPIDKKVRIVHQKFWSYLLLLLVVVCFFGRSFAGWLLALARRSLLEVVGVGLEKYEPRKQVG